MNEKKKQINVGDYKFRIGDLVTDLYSRDVGVVIERYENIYGYGPTYTIYLQEISPFTGLNRIVNIVEASLILLQPVVDNDV